MTPPKKPPPDRDDYVPKHPSGDAQRPASDLEWSSDTDAQAQALRNDDTPVGLETLDAEANTRMRVRVKETNSAVKKVNDAVEATNIGIDTLRFENKKDVQRLETKIGLVSADVSKVNTKVERGQRELHAKIDKLGEKSDEKFDKVTGMQAHHTGVLMQVVGSVGKLEGVVTEMVKTRDEKRQHETITFGARVDIDKAEAIAEVEIDKAEAVAKIEDKTDASVKKRAIKYKVGGLLLKILGAVGVLAATAIVTHFIEKCNH